MYIWFLRLDGQQLDGQLQLCKGQQAGGGYEADLAGWGVRVIQHSHGVSVIMHTCISGM
jgi:hypothetical protein